MKHCYTGYLHAPHNQLTTGQSGFPFTPLVVAKVKLMVQNKGIRIHQYQEDWLVRATHPICLQDTQTLEALSGTRVDSEYGKIRTGSKMPLSFQGQPLHPLSHALQIFTDASREG